MMIYSAILEIEGHANGERKDRIRYLQTLMDIRQSKIDGFPVTDVLVSEGNNAETRVKHFRYNYLCRDKCEHEPASYGVLRYFGLELIIDTDLSLGGIYKPNQHSELALCGKTLPYEGIRFDMPKAKA